MRTPCLSVCLFAVATPALAATVTFDTSQGAFDAGVLNQGWWAASRPNGDANSNYFTGYAPGGTDAVDDILRSFFTFDLSGLDLTGQVITGARLELVQGNYLSPDAGETLGLFDVSTDAATLNSNTGASAAIFADLGTGTTYGTLMVGDYVGSLVLTLVFDLNAAALADITAASGGWFSIGASLLSLGILDSEVSEGLFGGTSGNLIPGRLHIDTAPVPEPATLLLLGAGLAVLARRGRARP